MPQRNPSRTLKTPVMPVISNLFASNSDSHGFWMKDRSVPTVKSGEEAMSHPLSSSLLSVDIVRELRSAQYTRNKVKNKAKLAQARESKRQAQSQREYPAKRSKWTKRSGKRQSAPRYLATDLEIGYEQGLSDSVSLERRQAALAPNKLGEGRFISTSIPPKLQPQARKSPDGFTPPGVYTTATLPESTYDILAPDIAREFRSYERHRHQSKKSARFMQAKQKKDDKAKPASSRDSKSVKAENLKSLIDLTIVEEEQTSSEDEIQTPIEVSLSLILPDVDAECADPRAPTVDMETLVTMAKIKHAREPSFEFIKSVPSVIALDDCTSQDDEEEAWEHVWNDDLLD